MSTWLMTIKPSFQSDLLALNPKVGHQVQKKLQLLLEPSKRNPKTSSLAILSAVEALRTAYSSQLELGT